MKLNEKYHGMEMPQKLKIAVSGCPNQCAESQVRDIGLVGSKDGWKLYVGGNVGRNPRIGQLLTEGLSDDETMALVDKVMMYYQEHSKKMRMGAFIEEIGMDKLKAAVL